MRGVVAYCVTGLLAALAICTIAAIIPMPAVGARPMVSGGAAVQWVDRSGKSDRLDLNKSIVEKHRLHQAPHKIMTGCEPVFSPLVHRERASNFAGHCTA